MSSRWIKGMAVLGVIGTLSVFSGYFPFFKLNQTAQAVGDLTINWGVPVGDPIFTVPNMFPGQVETRIVQVTNNASVPRPIGVRGNPTNQAGDLGDALEITILQGVTPLYGQGSSTGIKTLNQFFTDSVSADGIPLLTLNPSQTVALNFVVRFSSTAANDFQASMVTFDITLGVVVTVPAQCSHITFSGLPIFGTMRSDRIIGTSGNDLIFGLEGGDTIRGGGGNDCILGGAGSDSLKGESGADVLLGEAGSDSLDGGVGDDQMFGGDGSDSLKGDDGNDQGFGGDGNDSLKGGKGNDLLMGEAGVDSANGQQDTDTCEAESENNCEL